MVPDMSDSHSLWQDAHRLMQAGAIERAQAQFEQAARAGHPAAQFDLGRMHVFAMARAPDPAQGLHWLRAAEDGGYAPAGYLLATLALDEVLEPFDGERIARRVRDAAQAGDVLALRTLGAWYAEADGSAGLAALCLEHAALRGDAVALGLLALRLREGRGVAADPARAAAMADLLIARGLPFDAAPAEQPRRDPAPVGLPPLPALPLPATALDRPLPDAESLCASPRVLRHPGLFGAEDCALLRLAGAPYLRPSITADDSGRVARVPIRSSHETLFDPLLEDVLLRRLQRRMAAAAGLPLKHAEHLILLRYAPGQEYRPHRDYLPPSLVTPVREGGSGQRQATAIAYLNSDLRGGATLFPLLGLEIAPRAGDVLVFDNLDAQGAPDERSLHAGLPVQAGEKWICTLWIRQAVHRTN
jgi:hypothetical protein